MLELYCNTAAPVPDRSKDDPLVLHIAFTAKDVKGLRAKLVAAGAKAAGDVTTTPAGDVLAIVRDPWGLSVQLASRAKPLV